VAIQFAEGERRVQVPFTATLDDGRTYSDALMMTAAEWTASTATSRKALMRDRVVAWQAVVDAPPEETSETDQERRQRLRLMRADALRAAAAAETELAETEPEEPEA
jgi:hypothetical protein